MKREEYLVADSDELGSLTVATPRQMELSLRQCAREWETDWEDAMAQTIPLSTWIADNPTRVDKLLATRPSRNAAAAIRREASIAAA